MKSHIRTRISLGLKTGMNTMIPEKPVREQNVVSVSCKQIQRNMWRWNELVPELSGFVPISGSKIQDFFQNNIFFFPTQGYQIGDQ